MATDRLNENQKWLQRLYIAATFLFRGVPRTGIMDKRSDQEDQMAKVKASRERLKGKPLKAAKSVPATPAQRVAYSSRLPKPSDETFTIDDLNKQLAERTSKRHLQHP